MLEDIEMKIADHGSKTANLQIKENNTLMLIEKYRPKDLTDMVSHEEIIKTINRFIEKKSIPHFLFHGPPGTGKTSCILAIARKLYGENMKKMVLELNASDDRGINVVRDRIKEFCNTQMIHIKGIKLVVLDEADAMTASAQFALRRVIEKYTKNARFCLICNQVSKIIPAIQSRCMRFRFNPLKPEQCNIRIKEICQLENIPIENSTVNEIIKIGKGDMRKILNILESTNNSYNKVNEETVYMCTGLPSFEDIKQIVNVLMTTDYEKAYNYLNELKIQKGFSVSDLVIELVRFVRMFYKKNIKLKLNILKWFSDIDYSACIGASEKILISNIVGIFSELRNDNWKFDI